MSAGILLICEDDSSARFSPLSDTRPVFDLRAGIFSARERAARNFPDRTLAALVRPEIREWFAASSGLGCGWETLPPGEGAWLLNGRVLAGEDLAEAMQKLGVGETLTVQGRPAAGRLGPAAVDECRRRGGLWPEEYLKGLPPREGPGEWAEHSWDFIARNPAWLVRDAESLGDPVQAGMVEPGTHVKLPERLHLAEGALVEAGCYLDASGGPIVIGAGARVRSHTRIEGPCWIGPGTELLGGRIGEGTSLGPECRIAGEIEETVVQGFSNKRHHGFVGHSYLGEWVNLGALTTTSDLKNNYGKIRMWESGAPAESGLIKLGSIVGDHAKTAIGTLLGTGTVVGVMSNVFRVAPPRHVPSFHWLGEGAGEPYRWAKAGPLAITVLGRRGVKAGAEYLRLLEGLARASGAV